MIYEEFKNNEKDNDHIISLQNMIIKSKEKEIKKLEEEINILKQIKKSMKIRTAKKRKRIK